MLPEWLLRIPERSVTEKIAAGGFWPHHQGKDYKLPCRFKNEPPISLQGAIIRIGL